MSYAVRNTIILLIVLLLLAGGGWAYLTFVQGPEIEELQEELAEKEEELQEQQQIAAQYPDLLELYETAEDYYLNFEKALYPENSGSEVFGYLNRLNSSDSFTDFSFTFNDSTSHEQYGIIRTQISGEGYYRNFLNLIRKLELNRPLNKIRDISITPRNSLEEYGIVDFNFVLESYYNRSEIEEDEELEIASHPGTEIYNPFFPLIREVEPNEENLINIENSEILAISRNRIFIIDQEGVMQKLNIGDEVYLGKLRSIDMDERTATFELNKGGIVEIVTMEAER